jgi:hypothetical protein
MKKIVKGKVYDAERSTEVASYTNHLGTNDHNHCYETLYRTKNGNWFLVGEGGPLTQYCKSVGNLFTSGSALLPLTSDEALEWLERNDEVSEIEEYFSDRIQEA